MIHFSAPALRVVGPYQAKTDIRFYLKTVRVIPHPAGGVVLAATDGHQLAAVYDPDGAAPEELSLRCLPQAWKAAGGRGARRVEVRDGRLVVLKGGDSAAPLEEVYVQPGQAVDTNVKGNYPDVFAVLPGKDDELKQWAVATMSPNLTERLVDTARVVGGRWYGGAITHWSAAKQLGEGAAYTRFTTHGDIKTEHVIVVSMPMRDGLDGFGAYWWEPQRTERKKEKAYKDAAAEAGRRARVQDVNRTSGLPLPGRQPSDAAPV